MNESNSDESKGQKSKGINSAKKVRADWVRKLGDNALEIRIGRLRRNSKDQKVVGPVAYHVMSSSNHHRPCPFRIHLRSRTAHTHASSITQ